MRKFVRYSLIVGVVIALLVLLYDAMGVIRWIGSTELTIEFVVTDAQTGQPLPGAEVYLEAESGWDFEGNERSLRVTADAEGRVRRGIPNNTCVGSCSNLRLLRDTRAVYVPSWRVTCRASGYQENDPFWLPELPHRQNVRQVGPRKDILIVPIALRKAAP